MTLCRFHRVPTVRICLRGGTTSFLYVYRSHTPTLERLCICFDRIYCMVDVGIHKIKLYTVFIFVSERLDSNQIVSCHTVFHSIRTIEQAKMLPEKKLAITNPFFKIGCCLVFQSLGVTGIY